MTTPQAVSEAKRRADELVGGDGVVEGPLKGYHHETYVLRLPGGTRTVKVREPRAQILWFDRRCFHSEEELLRALQGRITRIPTVLDVEGMKLQSFIEGRTVGRYPWRNGRVPESFLVQIVGLFQEMVRITPQMLTVNRRCESRDRADDGDSNGFLGRLVAFCEEQVFEKNRPRFGVLFDELGVKGESFSRLRDNVSGLTERPFCLLHGDLHRQNMIVDPVGQLWAIDWELAMLGDPLYDLATHIHLMKYPAGQRDQVTRAWREVVEGVRSGSSFGWERDLPRILAFKKAQSVPTDIIRVAESLLPGDGTSFNWRGLPLAALKLQKVLGNAAGVLGMKRVPGHAEIMGALVRWHRMPKTGLTELDRT
ncbi:aminoglycoside phosphotransferase family protein [Streptomyces sp. NPDC047072]|uniref:aminoglycoside phosphotransferase family protein n=1 Tax=Streptomyces sp. NPDC047072 TaxID=3154809 RepID=UPI003400EE79